MIIGICGLIGSGKGTVADLLEQDYNFTKLSFADSLKDVVSATFGWSRSMLEGDTIESRKHREQVDTWWATRLGIPQLTPRWILQHWGTEVCRVGFHDDIWIASMEHKLINLPVGNYVIPDTRFPNEINMIRNISGKVWKVSRGLDPDWFTAYIKNDIIPANIHPSEWMWAKSTFDQVICNNGTLNDLQLKIQTLLNTDAFNG